MAGSPFGSTNLVFDNSKSRGSIGAFFITVISASTKSLPLNTVWVKKLEPALASLKSFKFITFGSV